MEAYNSVRERFPGSPASIDAAMRMGRMFADSNHDDVTAAKWFERAYREGPNASQAAEAMGSWMGSLAASDRAAARSVAADYLRRFPNGPDAAQARELAR
jgi:TolA-binding protein